MQRPVLTPAALREQLVAVAEAHSKLSLAANALVGEVIDRQQVRRAVCKLGHAGRRREPGCVPETQSHLCPPVSLPPPFRPRVRSSPACWRSAC